MSEQSGTGQCATIARVVKRHGRASPALIGLATVALMVAGCGATITKHGSHLRPTDVQQVQPGMGEDQVRLALGSPSTTSATGNGKAYYYISSTTEQKAFFAPTEVDRTVLAVYFSPLGSVDRVANYGLKDGKVFDFISRTTPAANDGDASILQQMFKSIGRNQLFKAGE